ncbi:hypothetical protein ACN2AV_01220 [Lentilactobacillus buchneri subsp. silagei]|uniref:hypothetical protein n=1 Tax=Lentilactobacillus buchneri TaxID=1581 RepID=UPI003AFAC7DE
MATPNVGILTNAGKNLIDEVNAGQTKITFSKIVFSSMNNNQLTDEQIKALTTVAPQEIVVNNPKVTLDNNTGETRIRATGNNETLTDGVYVKTYAVYAKDDSGNEILYGITVSPNPNYLPEYDGVTPQAVTYSYKVNISNTSNITFTNSNDVYVSDTDLAEALQPCAKTVDVNQQLDKKVNVSDMRKPASDVAGIEEVSTLQTQVDNSAVGTNLLINTSISSINGQTTLQGASSVISGVYSRTNSYEQVTASSDNELFYRFVGPDTNNLYNLTPGETYTLSGSASHTSGKLDFRAQYSTNGSDWNNLDFNTTVGNYLGIPVSDGSVFTPFSHTFTIPVGSTGVYFSLENFDFTTGSLFRFKNMKLEKGSVATDWCPNPEDKVNVSDMRKPASDVAGIEEVNAKQDKLTITPADDSKVAHLSGANNFDTVPTVNNNPLLLASSLPSDLARTSQQTNFTAGLQSGGVSVATSDDLKSVEESAWRQLDSSHIIFYDGFSGTYHTDCLYKIDPVNKKIYIHWIVQFKDKSNDGDVYLDFSSVVSKFTSKGTGKMMCQEVNQREDISSNVDFSISGSKISFNTSFYSSVYASGPLEDCWFGYDTLLI